MRPAAGAALAKVFNRATLEANVVATTRPLAPATSASIGLPSWLSERPARGEKTFVLSQIRARTPASAISDHMARSKGSPMMGVSSSLKSPECTTLPAGVSITRPAASGIECEIGAKATRNGPASTVSG